MASLGTWPSTIDVISFRLVMMTNQRVNASPEGGSEQAFDRLNDRWMAYATLAQASEEDAAEIEALVNSFRGQVNWIELGHLARPAVRGTISGSPTLAALAAQGASSIQVQASVGQTVKKGDMLGVSGLLLMSSADATANGSGVITVSLTNRLRTGLASGAAVTISQPTAPFRLLSSSGVGYVGGYISEEVTLTFGEKI